MTFSKPLAGQTMNQLGSSQIMQNAYWSALEQMDLDASDRERGQTNIAFIANLLDQYDAAVSAINQNPDLSAQGRASAILAKSKSYLQQMETQTGAVMAALNAQINSASAKLVQAAMGPDASVIGELRAQEVRAWFAQVEDILRPSVYQKLIADGNTTAAIAIENTPGLPLIDPSVIADGKAQRSNTLLPKEAYGKQSATEIRDVLTGSIRFARKHLTMATTLDPLQVAPAGDYAIDGAD